MIPSALENPVHSNEEINRNPRKECDFMRTEKMLFLVNKAIECASEDDKAMIDLMRKTATKTADRASFGFTGAYLEELRCALLADIEAAEAKKNGKTNVLSAMKFFSKDSYKKSIDSKPYYA